MRLNLGCGQEYLPGYVNVDISKEVKADHYLDIRTAKLPADDNSCDEVYCGSVLEQVLLNEHLVHVLNECWRVLKSGANLRFVVPNSRYAITYQDPFDCRHFIAETFYYFDVQKVHYQRFGKTYGFKPWRVVSVTENTNHIFRVTMAKHVDA